MKIDQLVRATRFSRRHALRLLSSAAALPVVLPQARAFAQNSRGLTFPRGAIIRTALNDLAPDTLGAILVHEHVQLSSSFGMQGGPGAAQPTKHFSEDLDLIIEEMRLAKRDGVTALVDAGHADQGRRVPYLRQIAKASGMPIIVGGGYHSQASYPPEVLRMSEDELVEELVGYAAVERWGCLGEIGISATITADEHKMQRAIGRTQAQTGLPIVSHTANGASAVEQLDLFEQAGGRANQIVIGHMGAPSMVPIEVFKTICQRGAFVGFDRVGGRPESDEKQIPIIRALIDAGYVDNLLISSDGGASPDILKSKGGPGYGRAISVFAPKLRQAGVEEGAVQRIVNDNPRRLLAFVPGKPRR